MEDLKTFKQSSQGSIVTHEGGTRPTYMASLETKDPYIRALGETIFWTEQFKEHAQFMEMLLPVEVLPSPHERCAMFKGAFQTLFEKTLETELDQQAIGSVSMDFVRLGKELGDYQRQLHKEQTAGKIHSLMWPTFMHHLINESDRYTERVNRLLHGENIIDNRDEVITFGAEIMAEHAQFVAHLLDPSERDLFVQSLKTSDSFWDIQEQHPLEGNTDPVIMDIEKMIQFKTTALNGIKKAKIKSIIPPVLADHVRREAVLFKYELQRADMEAGIQPMAA